MVNGIKSNLVSSMYCNDAFKKKFIVCGEPGGILWQFLKKCFACYDSLYRFFIGVG